MSNRSRFRQSSSLGEIGVFRPFDSPRAFVDKKYITRPQPVLSSAPISQCIFTVGSPERENSDEIKKPAEGFGEFLHNCYFCEKRFSDKFFMYGPQCRDHQIVLDGFEEEMAKDIEMRMKLAEGLFKNKNPHMGFYPSLSS